MNERLERAIEDVRRLQRDGQPSKSDLTDAPTLDEWFLMWPALAGFVTGHPMIADGDFCITSPVLILDRTERWARTVSRFYILGKPGTSPFEP